jgi:hypothetical protein
MAAGITDTLMSMVAAMVEAATAKQGKRGPYKKRPAAALVQWLHFSRIAAVEPVAHLRLRVAWSEGTRAGRTEVVDLTPLIGRLKYYAPLRSDRHLFATAHLADEGESVEWGDAGIDMAATSIERLADEAMTASGLAAFLRRNDLTHQSGAAVLGYSKRQIENFLAGHEIPRVLALACVGYETLKGRRQITTPNWGPFAIRVEQAFPAGTYSLYPTAHFDKPMAARKAG